jgi:ATP-binding cassette subfamily C (CFTR/MRP) protein 1
MLILSGSLWLTILFISKGHGKGNGSGSSTPFGTSGSATPKSDGGQFDATEEKAYALALTEKLRYRASFQKARRIPEVATHKPSGGLTKEHQEQGRVKIEVYKQYIQAASKAGFAFFLFATIAQQAASVLATLTLRYWGEHNREMGDNSGMFKYLLIYGCFSLSSSLLGALSAITMWVYCALRSAKRLHDSVSAL